MSDAGAIVKIMTPTALLAFEHANPQHTPTKTARIRHELGLSEVRYYMLLGRAAHSNEGTAAHPVTARMVRERMSRRAAARVARTAA